ncbi:uncharacterized protein BDZ99DRAFT_558579 [Mytilinidion resinicola]|uniref:F-box domain-containing protein n=1 Tax=Mytilinidion resinicola TaxID=574789 RepID=A0A6A6YVG9_9PEZI|nr:uncharacterized protein BDZ99DRAFT_558579 [Mytilinidion resinicola]KAF2812519.1 hypothetical protein BDZ99DRAFT_558579 [Mytilinidion resinicola]
MPSQPAPLTTTPPLLRLPLELRDLIYALVFADLVITHALPTPSSSSSSSPKPLPPSHRTALLRTSSQLHHEARPHLLAATTLRFPSTESLLTTLVPLAPATLSHLRRIRVTAYPFPLHTDRGMRYYATYGFAAALALLPGLRVRELEVEDAFGGTAAEGVASEVGRLVASDGWQELRLVARTAGEAQWGGLARVGEWDRALKGKDGARSGASVSVWVGGSGAGKEVRLTATRGRGADIVQGAQGEEGRSWAEMKGKGVFPDDWERWYYDEADRAGWLYGGWSRRMQLAVRGLR